MPRVIFFKTSPLVPPIPEVTDISPRNNERIIAADQFVIIGLRTNHGLTVELSTLNVTIDGYAAIISNVAQPGFNYFISLGVYGGQLGYIIFIKPDAGLPVNKLINVQASVFDLTLTNLTTKIYKFTTVIDPGYQAHFQFGALPKGRYRLLTDRKEPSNFLCVLTDKTTYVFSNEIEFETFLSKRTDASKNYLANDNSIDSEIAYIIPEQIYRLDQVIGEPSPVPTFLGPRYASASLVNKQKSAIKLLPQVN